MALRIEEFGRQHDREGFCCGEVALDDFLKHYAGQHSGRDISRTYVALEDDNERILGFHSVSAGAIDFQNWPAGLRLPRYPIPVVRIGRLAVDRDAQGRGIGTALLRHAIGLALELAERIGVHAVVVDAKHERAAEFYRRHGFVTLQSGGNTLFVTMAHVRKAMPKS